MSGQLQKMTIDYNHELSKQNALQKELTELRAGTSETDMELLQLQGETERNQRAMDQSKAAIIQMKEKHDEIEHQISKLSQVHRETIAKREEFWNKITADKVDLAEKSKMLEAVIEGIQTIHGDQSTQYGKIEANKVRIVEDSQKIEREKELIDQTYSRIVAISEDIIRIRHSLSGLEQQRQEQSGKLTENERSIKQCEEALNDLTTSIYKLEVSKSKLETESEVVVNKLWDEYELTIPDAVRYRTEIRSITEENRKLNDVKTSIKALGDINVNAIEEYKRVKERYEFLTAQMDDLNKAQESLIEIIEEMTAKMTKNFLEKFKIIRENFNHTFKELFGGGVADLKLEGEDVLNSGIEIIVQPPGKKLQALTLLSGGERGLAAIALLFAILKMKPTPFCVLDEIEAALDDANVNRYAGFLRKYASDTQFITITHRKGSMAVADALYGVTMEEKGISKMLSLKLNGGL